MHHERFVHDQVIAEMSKNLRIAWKQIQPILPVLGMNLRHFHMTGNSLEAITRFLFHHCDLYTQN